jgi:hypothetical protein
MKAGHQTDLEKHNCLSRQPQRAAILTSEGDRLIAKFLRAFSAPTLAGWLGRISDLKLVFDELASHRL